MPPPPSTPHRETALGLLLAATLLVMAMATLSPALPGLALKFADQGPVLVPYLVSAPALSALIAAPFAGMLSDRFGHGRVMRVGSALFALCGMAGLFLDRLDLLLASRFALGLSVAMVMTSQTALIGHHFQGQARQKFLGWQVSARNAGGLIFVLLAGALSGIAPEYAFAVYGLTLLFLPVIWQAGRPTDVAATPRRRVDLRAPWIGPVLGVCAVQVMILILFFVMPTQLPFALFHQGITQPWLISLSVSALMICGALAGAAYGWLTGKLGQRLTIGLGFGLKALGFAVLLVPGLGPVMVGAALIGAAYAVLMASASAIALNLAPADQRGFVMGLLASAIFLGQSLSPVVSNAVLAVSGFDTLFIAFAAVSGICALAGAVWRNLHATA